MFGAIVPPHRALAGRTAGCPVAEIIAELREQFFQEIGRLAGQYQTAGQSA